jgi:hypothetical protein
MGKMRRIGFLCRNNESLKSLAVAKTRASEAQIASAIEAGELAKEQLAATKEAAAATAE